MVSNVKTVHGKPAFTPTPRWTVMATLAGFETGKFLVQTPPSDDVSYFTTWVTFGF